jgi:hypothetical protein
MEIIYLSYDLIRRGVIGIYAHCEDRSLGAVETRFLAKL